MPDILAAELTAANVVALLAQVVLLVGHGGALFLGWRRDNTTREDSRREHTNELKAHESTIAVQTQALLVAQFEAIAKVNTDLREEVRQVRAQLDGISAHVQSLELLLTKHGLEVPPRPQLGPSGRG